MISLDGRDATASRPGGRREGCMRNFMIGLGGTRVNARRSRARRKGVHAGLNPGSTDAKAQEEFYDRSGRQRRYSQSTKGQAGGGA